MMKMTPARLFTMTAIACAITACNNDDTTLPSAPQSLLGEQVVAEPTLTGTEIAVVDGDIPTTNNKANTVAYMQDYNPILQILSGFDSIWYLGDDTWANNGNSALTSVNGIAGVSGGASNSTGIALQLSFANEATLDSTIWQENFDYVASLTRQGQTTADIDRSDKAAMTLAYLDDQRDKGYSLTSGLGPWAAEYRTGAGSTSPYSTDSNDNVVINGKTLDVINTTYQNELYDVEGVSSLRTGYGSTSDTDLSSVVTLLNTIAAYGASTEAPKYHFESPRPWRMESDYSVAAFTTASELQTDSCVAADGTTLDETKYYDRPTSAIVTPMKGLLCAARTIYTKNSTTSYSEGYSGATSGVAGTDWVSGRAKDGAFPSGHTTEAFDRGLGFAYAMPERFQEMVARAADLGENRIVAAMHSPLDVIGGRIMGTAVTAATLYDSDNSAIAQAAVEQANAYFTEKMGSDYDSLYDYAHCSTDSTNPCSATDAYSDHSAMKERYRAYLTYGFSKLDEESNDVEVPKGAEVLLASRLPYLSAAQRRAVLATTEIDSNYPVINKSRGWGRINLVDAADGYGKFTGDVELYMDGSQGGFYAFDRWRNDISGAGRLHKTGTGALSLEGDNTYSGGTLLDAGTLVAASANAFGSSTLYQNAGTVKVAITAGSSDSDKGVLNVSDYVMESGTLILDLSKHAQISASGQIKTAGVLNLIVPTLTVAQTYTLLSAGEELSGDFGSVTATDAQGNAYDISVSYTDTSMSVTVSPSAA